MNLQKAPRSLRLEASVYSLGQTAENNSGKKVSAVAGLIAVASFSGAEAQQSNLLPVQNLQRIRSAPARRSVAPAAAHSQRRSLPCRFPMQAGLQPIAIPTQT